MDATYYLLFISHMEHMEENVNIVIIGGGASGLMAAITATKNHANVTVLEHTNKPGKKILMTGNGRCNLTNERMESDNLPAYFHGDETLISSVIGQFDNQDTKEFFTSLGLLLSDRAGYLYPRSMQASSVLWVLLEECARQHVKVKNECHVEQIKPIRNGQGGFHIIADGRTIEADKLILSCGSKAYPVTGSDGSGYELLKQLGIKTTAICPALCGLKVNAPWCKKASGVRAHATIRLSIKGQKDVEDTGEIQFTDYGISGIPVFQVSRFASIALQQRKQVLGFLDLFPEYTKRELLTILDGKMQTHPEQSMKQQLIGLIPEKLIPVVIKDAKNKEELAKHLKEFCFEIKGTNSFPMAQVACGGVPASEIDSKTLETKAVKNLYLTGELLDVDAICGGYNLQWAWSTGYVAAAHAANGFCKRK